MRFIGVLFLAALGAAATARANSAADPSEYTTDLLILKVPTTWSRLQSERATDRAGGVFVQGPFVVRWSGDSLRSDGPKVQLNDIDLWERRHDQAGDTRSPVYVMAAPSITALLGQEAQLKTSVPGGGPLQYMKKEADGRLSLQVLLKIPELSLRVEASKGEASGVFRLKWSYGLVRVGARRPVEGVTLDVGEPEIIEQNATATDTVKAGHWNLLLFGERGDGPGLAILMRIRSGR